MRKLILNMCTSTDQLFTEKLGPTILEIEEKLRTQSGFPGLTLRKTNAAALTSGGVLSAIIGFSSLLPPVAAVGGSLVSGATPSKA